MINKLNISCFLIFFPKVKDDIIYQLDLINIRYDTNFTHVAIYIYIDINDILIEIKYIFNDFESGIKNVTIMEKYFNYVKL